MAAKEKTCSYVFKDRFNYKDFTCPHLVYRNHDHCVFHHEDIEEKDSEFQSIFQSIVKEYEKSELIKFFDFRGFIFPEKFYFHKGFLKETVFSNCQFKGIADFSKCQFKGKVDFSNCQFKGEVDFSYCQFVGEANFKESQFSAEANFEENQFSENAYFNNSQFAGKANFKKSQFFGVADFEKSQFSGVANFRESQFSGEVDFKKSQFKGNTYFFESRFKGDAYFNKSKFSEEADFEKSQFSENVDFRESQFCGYVSFKESRFCGYVSFKESQFSGNASFRESQFSGPSDFRESQFSGRTYFFKSKFSGTVDFSRSTFSDEASFDAVTFKEYIEITKADFKKKLLLQSITCEAGIMFTDCFFHGLKYSLHQKEKLSFNQCRFGQEATFQNTDCSRLIFLDSNLSEVSFLGADLKETRFQSCQWGKLKGSRYSIVGNHEEIMASGDKDKIKSLRSLYRQLKQNFEENHDFTQSGDFHFREMQIREMQTNFFNHEVWFLKLYRLVSDYGENYLKLLNWIGVSIIVTTGIIALIEKDIPTLFFDTPPRHLLSETGEVLVNMLYNTILGILPSPFQREIIKIFDSPFSRIILAFETIVVLVLTALFVMAIRRRFRR